MNEEHSKIFERLKRDRRDFTIGICNLEFTTTVPGAIVKEIDLNFVKKGEGCRFFLSREFSPGDIDIVIFSPISGFYYFFTDTLTTTFKLEGEPDYKEFMGRFCFVYYGDGSCPPLHTMRLIKEEAIKGGMSGEKIVTNISGRYTKASR